MNRLFLSLVIFLFPLTLEAVEPSIIGRWELVDVEGETPDVPAEFEFGKDGKAVKRSGSVERKGNYTLSEDGKTLTIETGDKKSPASVVLLNETTLKIEDGGKQITLVRIGAEEKSQPVPDEPAVGDPKEPTVVGSWKLVGLGDEELTEKTKSSVFVFGEDGSFIRRRGTSVRRGTYKLSDRWEKEKTLTLTPLESKDGDVFQVITFTGTELVIDDGKMKITLTKISEEKE